TRKESPMIFKHVNVPSPNIPDLPPWLVHDIGLDGLDYWSVRLHFGEDEGPCYSGPRYFGSWPDRAVAEAFYVRAAEYGENGGDGLGAAELICDLLNLVEEIGSVLEGDEPSTAFDGYWPR